MFIGDRLRAIRESKGMSQGDIEKRTGLLRCYLSRVENGHTIPSLDTLARIATAMDLPLSRFFSENNSDNGSKAAPQLAEDEVRFLTQIRRYSPNLNDSDRKLVIAMVKKMAAENIVVSNRMDGLRVSFHLYNTLDDVHAVIGQLEKDRALAVIE